MGVISMESGHGLKIFVHASHVIISNFPQPSTSSYTYAVSAYVFTSLCRWRTKIVLNLKESHLTSNMAKKFNDIQPSLLLFLHRLRSITVQDEVHLLKYHRIVAGSVYTIIVFTG